MGIESIKFVTEKDFAGSEYSKKYSNYDAYLKAYNAAYMTQLKNIPLFKLNIPAKLNVNDTIWAKYNKAAKKYEDDYAELQVAQASLSDAKEAVHDAKVTYNKEAAAYKEKYGFELSGIDKSNMEYITGCTEAYNNENIKDSEVTGLIMTCRDDVKAERSGLNFGILAQGYMNYSA